MTKKLDDLFNLPPNKEDTETKSNEELASEVTEIVKALSNTEKIDHALSTVTGLNKHDFEMNEVAVEAMKSYRDLMEMGMNCTEAHAGRVFEAANSMLKTALEAHDAKASRKLKMVELQIRKAKLDLEESPEQETGEWWDRNDLLEKFKEIQEADTKVNNDNTDIDEDKNEISQNVNDKKNSDSDK